jgi:hypothetical protein
VNAANISPWEWIGPELAALGRAIRWSVEHWVAFVALVAALVYGSLRAAYSGFYGELGLRPEDVGLGYAEILAQTVPGLILISVTVLAGATILVAFVFAYEAGLSRLTAFSYGMLSRIPGLGFLGQTQLWRSSPTVYALAIYILVLAIAPVHDLMIVGGCLLAIVLLVELRERRWLGLATIPGLTGGLVLGAVFITALGLLVANAYQDGAAVKRGETRHPVVLGLSVASWGGDQAQVTSDAPAAIRKRNADRLMFLGQASGTAVLYDASTEESLRIPANSITIIVRR